MSMHEYENGSNYEVRELDPEEDAVYEVDDADACADNQLERAILAVAEEHGKSIDVLPPFGLVLSYYRSDNGRI
ncbi:hypothetical protein ACFVVQ_21165 [Paenibacillus chitinolyticus]|uniref:hypothetical protein n=1 Tax=Paenibacillus chitinolyticus TaxID=79263 RepID=UPI0036DAA2CE